MAKVERGIGFGRNSLPRSRNAKVTRLSDGEVLPHRRFFVPSFAVRRQLFPDETAIDFHKNLISFCEKKPYTPYDIKNMGMTILGKNRFTDIFLRADVQPEAEDMLKLAKNVRDSLGSLVKSKPHLLSVPLGNVAVFGNDNKIAVCLEGWKGFDRRYASKDDAGNQLANHQIVREINSTVGEITQFIDGGIDGSGDYVNISTRAIARQTPHFTFAEKRRGTISNNERADLNGQIASFMPPELKFFDPVVKLSLVSDGSDTTPYTNNISEATIYSEGLYVRRPKFNSFGGAMLASCVTQSRVA